jgi:DNA-binding MarR family transcriptional regulator
VPPFGTKSDARVSARRLPTSPQRRGFRVSEEYLVGHPQAESSATELTINVLYTAELLGRRLDRFLRPYGLARGSHNVLQILGGATGPLTPSEITSRLVATSATVTGLLDTLERRGLIERRLRDGDRRSFLVTIRPRGRRLLDELVPALIEQEKVWAAGVPRKEREGLISLLGALQDHLRSVATEEKQTPPSRSGRRVERRNP